MQFDQLRRRGFITLLGGAAVAYPLAARAQTSKRMRRVGVVMGYTERDPNGQLQVAAFRQQLQKFGWVEGSNLIIDFRYAADDADRIRTLARELLALAPDVMVSNSNLVTTILQSEIHTIPLVFISVSDPVGSGFVTDLARPTGNVTGFANFQPTMGSKWLDILRQIALVDYAGLLLHPEPPNFGYLKSAEDAAPSFNIELVSLPVQGQADIESALGTMGAKPNAGLVVAPNAVTFANSNLIIALAARYRLPAIYPFAFYAKSGGLVSYGFDAVAQFQQGTGYVDKLLTGARPTELPVQFPTKFELVVNLTTAKALGLNIPASLLSLADDLIE
jgi:putative ABC transport system substrate-binding protein